MRTLELLYPMLACPSITDFAMQHKLLVVQKQNSVYHVHFSIGSVLLLLTLLNCQSFLPSPVHSVFSCIDCVLYHWVCVRDDHHTVRKEKEEPKEPTNDNGREEVEF